MIKLHLLLGTQPAALLAWLLLALAAVLDQYARKSMGHAYGNLPDYAFYWAALVVASPMFFFAYRRMLTNWKLLTHGLWAPGRIVSIVKAPGGMGSPSAEARRTRHTVQFDDAQGQTHTYETIDMRGMHPHVVAALKKETINVVYLPEQPATRLQSIDGLFFVMKTHDNRPQQPFRYKLSLGAQICMGLQVLAMLYVIVSLVMR